MVLDSLGYGLLDCIDGFLFQLVRNILPVVEPFFEWAITALIYNGLQPDRQPHILDSKSLKLDPIEGFVNHFSFGRRHPGGAKESSQIMPIYYGRRIPEEMSNSVEKPA